LPLSLVSDLALSFLPYGSPCITLLVYLVQAKTGRALKHKPLPESVNGLGPGLVPGLGLLKHWWRALTHPKSSLAQLKATLDGVHRWHSKQGTRARALTRKDQRGSETSHLPLTFLPAGVGRQCAKLVCQLVGFNCCLRCLIDTPFGKSTISLKINTQGSTPAP